MDCLLDYSCNTRLTTPRLLSTLLATKSSVGPSQCLLLPRVNVNNRVSHVLGVKFSDQAEEPHYMARIDALDVTLYQNYTHLLHLQ